MTQKTDKSLNDATRPGIIGLGRMGRAIARRLADKGLDVKGWNRSALTKEKSRNLGIPVLAGIEDLAEASDILILSLFDDAAVSEVLERLGKLNLSGKLIVDTSTVGPETLRSFSQGIGRAGGSVIDAPISGGPETVLAGTAGLYIGGDAEDVVRFQPLAELISNHIVHVGDLGSGTTAKIVNNMMLLGYWQCLKEAIQVGKKSGLSAGQILEILSSSPSANAMLSTRLPVILGESDAVGFTVSGVAKDGALLASVSRQLGVPAPAIEAGLASFRDAEARGYGEADLAVMVRDAHLKA